MGSDPSHLLLFVKVAAYQGQTVIKIEVSFFLFLNFLLFAKAAKYKKSLKQQRLSF